jgi:pimeloyl-ACP methyl ester carboxylesterase
MPATSAPRGRYQTVGELDVYYEVHGHGHPLVLLHGALGTIESCFARLLPALARTRQVIAVELQAHGHTGDIDRPLSYRQMADDVAALLDALGITSTDVFGFSMGGGVALDLAVAHPHLVRRLVFAGGACFSPEGFHPELTAAGQATPQDLTGTPWHDAYAQVAPDPAAWASLVSKVGELDAGFDGWTPETITSITAPVLIIVGDADITRLDHVVEMFRLVGGGVPGDLVGLPPSRLAILPGTTHVGLLDRTTYLTAITEDVLGSPTPD